MEPYEYRPVDDASGRRDLGEPAPYVHQVTGYETSHRLRRVCAFLLAAGLLGIAVDYAVWQAVVRWWPR